MRANLVLVCANSESYKPIHCWQDRSRRVRRCDALGDGEGAMLGAALRWETEHQGVHSREVRNARCVEAENRFDRERSLRTRLHILDQAHRGDAKTVWDARIEKNAPEISSCGTRTVLRPRRIREKIIGRTIGVFRLRCGSSVRRGGRRLAPLMLQKPAGKQ